MTWRKHACTHSPRNASTRACLPTPTWGVDGWQVLLQYGADIDQADTAGRTPLLAAVAAGHADVAKHLLAKGMHA